MMIIWESWTFRKDMERSMLSEWNSMFFNISETVDSYPTNLMLIVITHFSDLIFYLKKKNNLF